MKSMMSINELNESIDVNDVNESIDVNDVNEVNGVYYVSNYLNHC